MNITQNVSKTISDKLIEKYGSPQMALLAIDDTIDAMTRLKSGDNGQQSSFHEWTANSIMDQRIDSRLVAFNEIRNQIAAKIS